LGTGRARLSAK